MGVFLIIRDRRGRAARLGHVLQNVKPLATKRVVLRQTKVHEERGVAQVAGGRVAVLVDGPLVLRHVGVAGPEVLGLQVLELVSRREPVRLPPWFEIVGRQGRFSAS